MSKSKVEKELKQKKQIAEGVAMIQEARSSVEELTAKYDAWIDEAAELGEDEYSDQLIEEKVELIEFVRNLTFLEEKVRVSAVTAKTFSELKKLPAAMQACKGLLAAGPNLKQLGKQMASFKSSLDGARLSLKDLRSELSASKDPVYTDLFGKKTSEDPHIASRIAAEKTAREKRLMVKTNKNAPTPVASEDAATDIDAITAMIDEENKKK